MLGINDLPNEILTKIFQKVPASDFPTVMAVCPRWYDIVDQVVGLFKFIGAGSHLWSDESFEPASVLSQAGIHYLALSNLLSGDGHEPPTPYKYPHLIHELFIDGEISTDWLPGLISPLFNLRWLTIHTSALGFYSYAAHGLAFSLPRLHTFSISQYSMGPDEFYSEAIDRHFIIENIIYLLATQTFPSLTTLNLHLPFTVQGEGPVLAAILSFVLKHKRSLKKLLVSFEFSGIIDPIPPSKQLCGPTPALPSASALAGLRLQKLFIHCTKRGRPSMSLFTRILEMQTQSLQKLHFTTGFDPIPLAVVHKNCSSLVTFEMTISSGHGPGGDGAIDMTPFGSCTGLKILTLVGPIKIYDASNVEDVLPDLYNVICLPSSLESVRLFNLYLESEDVDYILLQLPKLKIVNLHGIGFQGTLGIKLETLAEMVNLQRIAYLSTVYGFNKTSLIVHPPTLDPNNHNIQGDAFKWLASIIIRSVESSGFVLQLDGSKGEYKFDTRLDRTLPLNIADDPLLMIDHEANIEFAIENADELFEVDEDLLQVQVQHVQQLAAGGGLGGGGIGVQQQFFPPQGIAPAGMHLQHHQFHHIIHVNPGMDPDAIMEDELSDEHDDEDMRTSSASSDEDDGGFGLINVGHGDPGYDNHLADYFNQLGFHDDADAVVDALDAHAHAHAGHVNHGYGWFDDVEEAEIGGEEDEFDWEGEDEEEEEEDDGDGDHDSGLDESESEESISEDEGVGLDGGIGDGPAPDDDL